MTLDSLHSSSRTTAEAPLLPPIASVVGSEAVIERREEPIMGEVRRAPKMGSRFGFSVEPTPADSGCGPDPVRIGRRKT